MSGDCKQLGAIGCKEVSDFSVDYLEGSLAAEERQRFELHLSRCPECVRYFETYKKTPHLTRDCFMVGMPDEVRAAIREFLRSRCRNTP